MKIYVVREDTCRRLAYAVQCDKCGAELLLGSLISERGWLPREYEIPDSYRDEAEHLCPHCFAERVGVSE